MNAASDPRLACAASCFRLSRSGPIVPFAPAALSVWQPPQPFDWNTASPGEVVVLPPFFCQAAKAVGERIVTWLRISEWPRPQSSVQMTGNVPVRVGVTTILLCSPGTASCFCSSWGTQNEWITSFEVMSRTVCRPSGIVRYPDFIPFGYVNDQANWTPTTCTRHGSEPAWPFW